MHESLQRQCHPHPKGKEGPKRRRETCANIRHPSSMSRPSVSEGKQSQPTSHDEQESISSSSALTAPVAAPIPGTPLAQESSGASDITVVKAERGSGGDVSPCTQPYDERMEDVDEEREPLTTTRMSMDVDGEQEPVGQQQQQFGVNQDHQQQDSRGYEPKRMEKDAGGPTAASSSDIYFFLARMSADDDEPLGHPTHDDKQHHHEDSAYTSLFTTLSPFASAFSAAQLQPSHTVTQSYLPADSCAFDQGEEQAQQQTPLMGLGVCSLPPSMSMMMPHGAPFSFPLASTSQFTSDDAFPTAFAPRDHHLSQQPRKPSALMQRLGSVDVTQGYPLSMSMATSMSAAHDDVLAIAGRTGGDGEMDSVAEEVPTSSALDSLHGFVGML
jgi:hypothetical protein